MLPSFYLLSSRPALSLTMGKFSRNYKSSSIPCTSPPTSLPKHLSSQTSLSPNISPPTHIPTPHTTSPPPNTLPPPPYPPPTHSPPNHLSPQTSLPPNISPPKHLLPFKMTARTTRSKRLIPVHDKGPSVIRKKSKNGKNHTQNLE